MVNERSNAQAMESCRLTTVLLSQSWFQLPLGCLILCRCTALSYGSHGQSQLENLAQIVAYSTHVYGTSWRTQLSYVGAWVLFYAAWDILDLDHLCREALCRVALPPGLCLNAGVTLPIGPRYYGRANARCSQCTPCFGPQS